MFKKVMLVCMAALLSLMIVSNVSYAQAQNTVMPINAKGGGFVIFQFTNLKPINDFLQNLSPSPGFGAYPDNIPYYGASFKGRVGENFSFGCQLATTLGGLDVMEPNFLVRERQQGGSANNLSELNMMFAEGTINYQFVRAGGFYIDGGCGIGFGGSRLTIFGDKWNGRFGMLSTLISPKFDVGYICEGCGKESASIMLSLKGGFNYFPNCANGWWKEAGNIASLPGVFDMSGWYIGFGVGVGIPITYSSCPKKPIL